MSIPSLTEEEYEREVRPLMDALYQKCVELGLPLVALIQFSHKGDNFSIHRAVNLEGPEDEIANSLIATAAVSDPDGNLSDILRHFRSRFAEGKA